MKPRLSFGRMALGLCAMALAVKANAASWQMKQPPLATPWTSQVNTNTPLPEYPRPQMVRSNWLNLNGIWQFEPGVTNSDPVPTNQTLSGSILVPYPMESAISGVMQYHAWSWYRTLFTVPAGWSGQRILLHLDAVTWQAQVYVNGRSLGIHKGGYDPITFDITSYLSGSGPQELIVQVFSPEDNGGQPRGKQTLYPGGIMYMSASGIWQPVWLEPVSSGGAQNLLIIPDIDNSRLRLTVNTYASNGVTVLASVTSNGVAVASGNGNPDAELDVSIPTPRLWSPSDPFLYGLQVSVVSGGTTNDSVSSYFGMRKIAVNTSNGIPQIYLNNQLIFGMGPLDQGYWPDGIYTAPTDEALKFDIQEIKALGFNTIRKHEKVERQRWYYWADTVGLMVWQDMPTCNSYTGNPTPPAVDPLQFIAELTALVTNHWNSPSIIMWDIFNEGQGEAGSANGVGQTNTAYLTGLVKALDPSRLVNQASGGSYFGVGDVLDNHSYPAPGDPTSTTQAAVDGEFGGIGYLDPGHMWNPAQAFVGYVTAPSIYDYGPLYAPFIEDLISYKAGGLNAGIYTQITDVENECDGLLTYDRILKADPAEMSTSNQKAITGQISVTTTLPTSQNQGRVWQYTTNTNTAATDWYATDFNDSSWSSGLAPFGQGDPGVVTPWTTDNIWIRQEFAVGSIPPAELSKLAFYVFHDEGCEIYLNGVLAASATGYTTSYVWLPMNQAGQAALIQNGTNLIAIHCLQTVGGEEIDAGIYATNLTANTLTLPTDYAGYWPLDETNGTVAADVSGNGDNGTVNGASWNPAGKVDGCLSFDGTDDYVQVNCDISNDFSIAFWVQTTATGGAGTWRQGEGLVDGSVGAGANDFGTALLGNQFAFGTGDPDTTLTSTGPINDGQWHYCVATRVQSTGAMQVYVDGSLQASGTGTTNALTAPTHLRFGGIQSGGGFFKGKLDEIKTYDRCLGNLEIAALYDDGAAPPAAPTNLTGVTAGGQVTLNWWEAPVASSYNVSRSLTSGGPYTLLANVSTLSYTDTNIVPGLIYYYVVAAADSAGTGPNSSEAASGAAPILEHRYSFTSDASDSIGDANGTLMGNAQIVNGTVSLPGGTTSGGTNDSYVALPNGIVEADSSLTIETWLTDNAGSTWAEPWSFGDSSSGPGNAPGTGTSYIGLIPHSGEGDFRAAFNNGASEIDVVDPTNPLPLNTEQYVVVTYDAPSQTATLYLNGVPVGGTDVPNDHEPAFMGNTYNDWLGRDQFGGDPTFTGSIDELRIWNEAVSPLYIALSTLAGPNVLITNQTPVSVSVTVTNTSLKEGQAEQAEVSANFPQVSSTNLSLSPALPVWTSSNPNVLTVNAEGLITAVSGGSATISATIGGISGTSVLIAVPLSSPAITEQPVSELRYAGGSAVFTVGAVGGQLNYQWSVGTGVIEGATNATLTLTALALTNAGNYSVVISNSLGSVTSAPVSLTVVSPTGYQETLLGMHPLAYWPLSETNGTIAYEMVGGNNGTYVGGVILGQPGVTNSGSGVSGYAASFNGTSGYVDIPEGPFNITRAITVMAWVNLSAYPSFAGVFGHGDPSWRLSVNSSGEAGGNDGVLPTDATSQTSIIDGNWHCVAYTYTGSLTGNNGSLYVDGALVANNAVSSAPAGDNLDVWIGGSPDYGTQRLLAGKIAHAAVFNQALTAAQVQDLYTGQGPVDLNIAMDGAKAILTWSSGTLLQASSVNGPWMTNSAATSPYSVQATNGNQFFKVIELER